MTVKTALNSTYKFSWQVKNADYESDGYHGALWSEAASESTVIPVFVGCCDQTSSNWETRTKDKIVKLKIGWLPIDALGSGQEQLVKWCPNKAVERV